VLAGSLGLLVASTCGRRYMLVCIARKMVVWHLLVMTVVLATDCNEHYR
jgi:hypothetical protein